MPSPLPPSPSLTQLKLQAKELRRAHQEGDAEASARVARFLPAMGASPEAELSHRDAQFVIAREHGFASWPKLKQHVESQRQDDASEDLDDHFRRIGKLGEETLGEWLYPNAAYGGGGWADDRRFCHIQGQTADSLDQLRKFYWRMCEFTHDGSMGGSHYFIDRYPKRMFRNGPPLIVVHATEERTISILALPSSAPNHVELYITSEDH